MIETGSYCLATKWSDGEAWDPWAVGFYEGEIFEGRFSVVDEKSNRFRHGGFRRCQVISCSQGSYLLKNAKELELAGTRLWDFLPSLDKETKAAPNGENLKET